MIYTLTLNPSIDYVVHMNEFIGGITNRTTSEEYFIGGKGINVSCILAELGIESTALGFTAGFTGEAIENGLKELGICSEFIRLKEGISRINIKVKADKERAEAPARRRMIRRRKKVCIFCAEKIDRIDYKDTTRLRKCMTERAKILPRRVTGTCAYHQRELTKAIKRARHVALLPYVAD